MSANRQAGFTLIELVIVMVIISVGLLGLTSLFSNTSTSLSTNETLQQATQYAQECAERAIATRRRDQEGFAWFAANTFTCGTTAPTGFVYNDSGPPLVGDLYDGTGNPCPSGTLNCRNINVRVTSTADTSLYSAITVMLVNY